MNGADVLRSVEEMRPRVEPFLETGEQFQVWVGGSWGRPRAVRMAIDHFWPFLSEQATVVLVATDRRWLVLRSKREQYAGRLTEVASFPRDIRVHSSWTAQFTGFGDVPLSIDPVYELWAVAANDALDAAEEGRPWSLEAAAPALTDAEDDPVIRRLEPMVMPVLEKVGRLIPPRPRFLRR
ncbi:hypothetical protein AB3X52_11675 [Nocardioides sp. DS6]|uniref:Uncharacterized protein n=1 Tax=Nocardioides eburneus TaxID=3231482 RepID=A0ABV3T318_9ACTN